MPSTKNSPVILFQYKTTPIIKDPTRPKTPVSVIITDAEKDNVCTLLFGKEHFYTVSKEDLEKIIKIIQDAPALFDIPEHLEPNDNSKGHEYFFTFNDGERTNSFSGYNIRDYGRKPRKNATLALRTARRIKEEVLSKYNIRTMIPSRLQNWPRYRKPSGLIKI